VRKGSRGVLPIFCTASGVEVGLKTELYALEVVSFVLWLGIGYNAMLNTLRFSKRQRNDLPAS
jgi:hypothetical protein